MLFTLHGAARHDPAIDEWLATRPDHLAALARPWFDRIRACGPDVLELMHDGCPTACVGDAACAYVNVFTAHVNVGFFRGAMLPDPARLLTGTGKSMRHVKLVPGGAIDAGALEALIVAAYTDLVAQRLVRE